MSSFFQAGVQFNVTFEQVALGLQSTLRLAPGSLFPASFSPDTNSYVFFSADQDIGLAASALFEDSMVAASLDGVPLAPANATLLNVPIALFNASGADYAPRSLLLSVFLPTQPDYTATYLFDLHPGKCDWEEEEEKNKEEKQENSMDKGGENEEESKQRRWSGKERKGWKVGLSNQSEQSLFPFFLTSFLLVVFSLVFLLGLCLGSEYAVVERDGQRRGSTVQRVIQGPHQDGDGGVSDRRSAWSESDVQRCLQLQCLCVCPLRHHMGSAPGQAPKRHMECHVSFPAHPFFLSPIEVHVFGSPLTDIRCPALM